MKKISLFVLLLLLAGAACNVDVSPKIGETPKDAPEECKINYGFPVNFPHEAVYPDSLEVQGSSFDAEEGSGSAGWLGTLCAKATKEELAKWYKNKYEKQGFEYATMETTHFWQKGKQRILLDFGEELGNGYMKYSLDVRGF